MKKILLITILFHIGLYTSAQNLDTLNKNLPPRRIQFGQTSVNFIPPKGFVQPKKSKAFIHKATASSLLIFEIPGISYALYIDTLNANYFESQNLKLLKKEKKSFSKMNGYLLECKFKANSHTFNRLIYVTGNLHKTILYVVNYPEQVKSEIKPSIYQSIRSLQYGNKP
jgi:hypothetical protein